MAYDLTRNQRRFVQRLAARTGLNSRVLAAQVFSEMNGGAAKKREDQGYYNWLNVGETDSGSLGLTGDKAWKDPIKAADATADFFAGKRYGPSPGIRNIIKTAGRSPEEQIRAIGRSGWATNPAYESTIRDVWKNIEAPGASGPRSTGPVPTGGDQGTTTTTTTGAGFDAGQASALAEMVKQQSRPQAPVSAPAAPAFSAQAPMPTGYRAPSAQPVQSSGGSSLADQLQAISQLQGQSIPQVEVSSKTTRTTGGSQQEASATPAASGGGGGVPFNTTKGGYKGSQTVATSLAAIGKDLGLKSTSEKRNNTNPYSGKGSDHEASNKDAYAYDLSNGSAPTPEMDRAAYRIMRQLGFKNYKMGQPINTSQGVATRGKYRVQVIYRGSGAAFGGNHTNHVHVGVRRVR
jgi:hypothetical protein